MITAALRGVSEDLYEAADVDGSQPVPEVYQHHGALYSFRAAFDGSAAGYLDLQFPGFDLLHDPGRARGVLQSSLRPT